MIVAFIDAYRGRFGVVPICAVLSEHGMRIAPSTYYAAKATPVSDADVADAYAANALLDRWIANRGVYGVRKLWHEAQRKGHDLGRDQVGRLMAITGITGVIRGEHRTRTTDRPVSRSRQAELERAHRHRPAVGRRLHIRVDAGRVRLRRVRRRRVQSPDPRLDRVTNPDR